jgi:CoA:oxalate CoA-transferase
MEKVLTGIRIFDFARYLAGPYCGTLLSDMGAEVIRIERPGGEEDRRIGAIAPNGESLFTMTTPRNKKAITLNLRTEKGREILRELVRRSDVVLHNFMSGTEEAKILSYESLKEINPTIIVTTVSGFDRNGPYAHLPSFDFIAQALSGIMSYTGFSGNPPTRNAMAYVDFGTALHAALGTVLALYNRLRTGEGQAVDVALLDVAVSFMAGTAATYKVLGQVYEQIGNNPYYMFADTFQTRDGWVMVAPLSNPLWRRFLRAIGREDLKDDPRFKDDLARFENRHLLQPIVSQWMKERTAEEAVQQLEESRVPCGRVNNIPEMIADPKVKSTGMLMEMEYPGVGKVPVPGVAIKMSQTPGKIERRAPKVGEHNEEIYCGLLGFSQKDLPQLEAENVI